MTISCLLAALTPHGAPLHSSYKTRFFEVESKGKRQFDRGYISRQTWTLFIPYIGRLAQNLSSLVHNMPPLNHCIYHHQGEETVCHAYALTIYLSLNLINPTYLPPGERLIWSSTVSWDTQVQSMRIPTLIIICIRPAWGHVQLLHIHISAHISGDSIYTSSLVKLSEDEIPDFQNFWVVFIDELGHISVSDAVIVDLRARTTGTKLSHLPEIVFHAKRQHTMLRNSVW